MSDENKTSTAPPPPQATTSASTTTTTAAKKLPQSTSAFEIDSDELAKKRTGYYDSWAALTKEETERIKAEEEAEKQRAAEKLGLAKDAPKSEAERIDREKREALKEAKRKWDGKKAQEEEMKFNLSDKVGLDKVLTPEDIGHRPVLVISNCKDCKLTLSENLGTLIKVFVDGCENTEVTVACTIITQHIEVSHSEKMRLIIAKPTHTVQVDLVNGITVRYNQNCLQEEHKLYHAGVKDLLVEHFDEQSIEHDYSNLEREEDNVPTEEHQFVTHLKNNILVTERVRRSAGIMPLTDAELSKVAGVEEIEAIQKRRAADKKIGGNEAFKNGEYMQAGVFYTEAMQLAPNDKELLCICLANRAACNLKLGRLEEAYDDSVACIAVDEKYVKGWFRKGIALHAQKKYGPAIEALSKADSLEPKNKQIQEALGFAKVMLQKQLKEQAEKWSS